MTDATDMPITHDQAEEAARTCGNSPYAASHPPRATLRAYIAQQRALAAARATAGGVRADPTKVRWVDPIGSCWVQIPDDWKDYHNHGDVRVTLRPSGEKIDDVVAVACPSPPREVPEGERYVLGEGYGVGKGILNDGDHVGAFAWVGLTAGPGGGRACPLTFPSENLSRIIDGKLTSDKPRRRFRLVLEVIAAAEAAAAPTQKGTP